MTRTACIWCQQRIPGRRSLTELIRTRVPSPAALCFMPQASTVQRPSTRNRRAEAFLGRSDLARVPERAAGGRQPEASGSTIPFSPSAARQHSTVTLAESGSRGNRRQVWR